MDSFKSTSTVSIDIYFIKNGENSIFLRFKLIREIVLGHTVLYVQYCNVDPEVVHEARSQGLRNEIFSFTCTPN